MVDQPRIAQLTEQLIEALGIPPELRQGDLDNTPLRVARAWAELVDGYQQDPKEVLSGLFDVTTSSERPVAAQAIVSVRPITFSSTCEHHLLPFFGQAKIAYCPAVRDRRRVVVGLSKLIRLVNLFSRRLSMQERIAEEVAGALMDHAHAEGVLVILRCRHTCLCSRGVRQVSAETGTLFAVGTLAANSPMHVTAVKMLDPTPRAGV